MKLEDLDLAVSDEYGVHFETGKPVTFKFIRSTEKAPNFGAKFGQDIEPAGRYMLHNPDPGKLGRGWEVGEITFEHPLVLELVVGGHREAVYGPNGWKARLFGATRKKHLALSQYLRSLGYDAIVTVDDTGYTREIVDLTGIATANPGAPRTFRIQKAVTKLEKSPSPTLARPGMVANDPEGLIDDTLAEYLEDNVTESFLILHLDIRNRVIGYTEFTGGEVSGVGVHPGGIFRDALGTGAAGIITVHNHPTGDPTPSDADENLWARIKQAGDIIGIPVVDNMIVGGDGRFYSQALGSSGRAPKRAARAALERNK